jgi:hypothetical protein
MALLQDSRTKAGKSIVIAAQKISAANAPTAGTPERELLCSISAHCIFATRTSLNYSIPRQVFFGS